MNSDNSEGNMMKAHCPKCNDERNTEIVCEHIEKWEDDVHPLFGWDKYLILKCRGCDRIFFRHEEFFSENMEYGYDAEGKTLCIEKPIIEYWPALSKRVMPDWLEEYFILDPELNLLLREVYTGLNNDLRTLAAIGIRTVFDKAVELLGVPETFTFQAKLDELVLRHLIGAGEKETLKILTDAGSAAAHRGWKPTGKDLNTLMAIIEQFVYRAFILQLEARQMKTKIPPKRGGHS